LRAMQDDAGIGHQVWAFAPMPAADEAALSWAHAPEATRRLGQVHELSPSDKDEADKLLP
jgi:hypothetical protein